MYTVQAFSFQATDYSFLIPIYYGSKNIPAHLSGFFKESESEIKTFMEQKKVTSLPPIKVENNRIIFHIEKYHFLEILNPELGQYRLDGKTLNILPGDSFLKLYETIEKQFAETKTSLFNIFAQKVQAEVLTVVAVGTAAFTTGFIGGAVGGLMSKNMSAEYEKMLNKTNLEEVQKHTKSECKINGTGLTVMTDYNGNKNTDKHYQARYTPTIDGFTITLLNYSKNLKPLKDNSTIVNEDKKIEIIVSKDKVVDAKSYSSHSYNRGDFTPPVSLSPQDQHIQEVVSHLTRTYTCCFNKSCNEKLSSIISTDRSLHPTKYPKSEFEYRWKDGSPKYDSINSSTMK